MVNSLRIFAEVNENCIQTSIHRLVKVEAMTEKEVYEFLSRFLKLLITEPYNDLPRLIGVETTNWTQDPDAGFGTYSAVQ